MEENKPRKKFIRPKKVDVCTENYLNKVRTKLGLTKKELSDRTIKKVIALNQKHTIEWLMNNPDGFAVPDGEDIRNGSRLAISKYMPKYLRGDKEDVIENIKNNPKLKEAHKKTLIERYQKTIQNYKRFISGTDQYNYNLNLETFFYIYRAMWFNKRNTTHKKLSLYEFKHSKNIKHALIKAVREDKKDFYEWEFSDFVVSRKRRLEEKQKQKLRVKRKK